MPKLTTHTFRKLKGQRPIVAVTSYDAPTARYAAEAGVDIILVGDSVGDTMLGFDTTIPVTLDMMCHHGAAVVRARTDTLVAVDLPFAEAHHSHDRLLASCRRIMQETGADAVKIEGGAELAPAIARITAAGIPVWGHIGLRPQQVLVLGRYKKFGATPGETENLIADARALEQAGVFSIVLELTDHEAARKISAAVSVPVIGIGAGPHCDGQILVAPDFLGLTTGGIPSFVQQFADAAAEYRKGFAGYVAAVREKKFPQ
jgi:3-methyl-2-oxobutanoate hydroxymethyltransferase